MKFCRKRNGCSALSLRLTALLLFCGERIAAAKLVNLTVDDTSPSISYRPVDAWSSSACNGCVEIDDSQAFQRTYHLGARAQMAHNAPVEGNGDDEDDIGSNDSKGDGSNGSGSSGSNNGGGGKGKDFILATADLVTLSFSFNGSAVYLFTLPAKELPKNASTPKIIDLLFTLDGQTRPFYQNTDPSFKKSRSADGTTNLNVFSVEHLAHEPHILNVTLAPNSFFAFDYLVYTHLDLGDTLQSSQASTSETRHTRNNVPTFAAAIAGSVGVLALFSLILCLSIWYRRRRARRRERGEASWGDAQPAQSAPQQGEGRTRTSPGGQPDNVPFTPRYFPGTVPPSYDAATSSTSNQDDSDDEGGHGLFGRSGHGLSSRSRSHRNPRRMTGPPPGLTLGMAMPKEPGGEDPVPIYTPAGPTDGDGPPPPPFGDAASSVSESTRTVPIVTNAPSITTAAATNSASTGPSSVSDLTASSTVPVASSSPGNPPAPT